MGNIEGHYRRLKVKILEGAINVNRHKGADRDKGGLTTPIPPLLSENYNLKISAYHLINIVPYLPFPVKHFIYNKLLWGSKECLLMCCPI